MSKQTIMGPIVEIPVESLVAFPVNPFGLYIGQRLDDLVESIEANGVLVPIIVRPLEEDAGGEETDSGQATYEILSGHNRVEAAKVLSLETVPAVVRDDLTDEEALLVVVETNLLQRSLADLSHSERAMTLSIHYDAIKSQGRRTDLIKEVEELLKDDFEGFEGSSEDKSAGQGDGATSGLVGQKLGSRERIALEQGLSERNVARYLRVNRLIQAFKDRLDSGALALYAAVSLSYLSQEDQELVYEVLSEQHDRLSLAEADLLRKERKPLTREAVLRIVEDPRHKAMQAPSSFKLEPEFLSRYFKPEQSQEEISEIIAKALDQYFNR